ncbi:MAG: toxin co-regulated pilus biosynthesis Q family protein [Acetobacter sp.]|nr:toxin co-regulated pilus biosynthesis Q family protein [Acetobacter sp.]
MRKIFLLPFCISYVCSISACSNHSYSNQEEIFISDEDAAIIDATNTSKGKCGIDGISCNDDALVNYTRTEADFREYGERTKRDHLYTQSGTGNNLTASVRPGIEEDIVTVSPISGNPALKEKAKRIDSQNSSFGAPNSYNNKGNSAYNTPNGYTSAKGYDTPYAPRKAEDGAFKRTTTRDVEVQENTYREEPLMYGENLGQSNKLKSALKQKYSYEVVCEDGECTQQPYEMYCSGGSCSNTSTTTTTTKTSTKTWSEEAHSGEQNAYNPHHTGSVNGTIAGVGSNVAGGKVIKSGKTVLDGRANMDGTIASSKTRNGAIITCTDSTHCTQQTSTNSRTAQTSRTVTSSQYEVVCEDECEDMVNTNNRIVSSEFTEESFDISDYIKPEDEEISFNEISNSNTTITDINIDEIKISDDTVLTWEAEEGENLRELLTKWSAMSGWKLLWQTNRNYILSAGVMFKGKFADVSSALIRAFARARPAPIATYYKGNRVIVVETMENENAY